MLLIFELIFLTELPTVPPRCILRHTQSGFTLCYTVMDYKFQQVLFHSNDYYEIILKFIPTDCSFDFPEDFYAVKKLHQFITFFKL